MNNTVWVLTCWDQTAEGPRPPVDLLAVSPTLKGINAYLKEHWCHEEESECRVNDDGYIVERQYGDDDGWFPWERQSTWDNAVMLYVEEVPIEEESA